LHYSSKIAREKDDYQEVTPANVNVDVTDLSIRAKSCNRVTTAAP